MINNIYYFRGWLEAVLWIEALKDCYLRANKPNLIVISTTDTGCTQPAKATVTAISHNH